MKSILLFHLPLVGLFSLSACFFNTSDTFSPTSEVELDKDGVIIAQPPIWVVELASQDVLVQSFMDPVIYKDKIVTTGNGETNEDWFLTGLNVEDGEELWRWNDFVVSDYWYDGRTAQIGSLLFKQRSNASNNSGMSLYAIDINDGLSKWTITSGRTLEAQVITHKNFVYTLFFDVQNNDSTYVPVIYQIDSSTGDKDSLTVPPIRKRHFEIYNRYYGRSSGINAFVGINGEDYLLIPYSEREESQDSHGTIYVSLYNITKQVYEYEGKLLTASAVSFMKPTIIYQESLVILNSNKTLFGVDLYSGDILWERAYPDGVFSMIIVDDVLVASQVLGADAQTFGLNPLSGSQLWSMPSGGGASTLTALNGVVYWKDRGDGNLYAVEAKTGQLMWKLDNPDPESNSGWKREAVAVWPGENGETGRVYASTFKRMYCYEAAR